MCFPNASTKRNGKQCKWMHEEAADWEVGANHEQTKQ